MDIRFMEIAAQVLPVLLLAAVLEHRSMIARHVDIEGPTHLVRSAALAIFGTSAVQLLVGESAALYAVATQKINTFLVLLVISTGFAAVLEIFLTAPRALGLGFRTYAEEQEEVEQRWADAAVSHAERLEARARKARDTADAFRKAVETQRSNEH